MIDKFCTYLTNKIRKEMPEVDDERAEVINYGIQLIIGEIPKIILIVPEEIAIEENKELLTEQGISENVIDSGTSVLRSVDAKQLNKILSEDINIDEIQQQLEDGATPTEILNNIQQDMSTTDKISLGVNLIMAFTVVKTIMWIIVVLIIYNIIVRWRIYKKKQPHREGFVPDTAVLISVYYVRSDSAAPAQIMATPAFDCGVCSDT